MTDSTTQKSPLNGIKVLDLSRILAGPSATQILGDLGADIIKIERPNTGDDTRKWGPPYLNDGTESAYYLSANRNKRSITIDYTTAKGQDLIHKLARHADIVVENYKTGTLDKYGIGYKDLSAVNPRLIYCSLTGFGQTGPYADRAGYDFMIQAMGGIMSLTGDPENTPSKTGVAIADLMAGMYLNTGILAALHHRHQTGEGQFIDISLMDTQVAWLSNAAQYYLTSGDVTPRMGNAHPTIVPYEAFETKDSHIILAIGNDRQFSRFCELINRQDLSDDAQFSTNQCRVENRKILVPILKDIFQTELSAYWLATLEDKNIPCGPVNNLQQVFDDPQVKARDMVIQMQHPDQEDDIDLIANPIKFSKTPVTYRQAPPKLGQHNHEILKDWLSMTESDIEILEKDAVI